MKAAVIHGYGGPDVLTFADVPEPVGGPDDLEVEVHAVGVNPADYKFRRGDFSKIYPKPLPHILGMDVAGIVRKVGDAVQGFAAGDRVFAMVPYTHHGGYAQRVAAPAAFFAHLPDALDFTRAAALPTPAHGGMQMVEKDLNAGPDHRILVTGVTGNSGRYAAWAAKARGAHVTAAVRGQHADEVRGVDAVIILDKGPNAAGADYDSIADTVGGEVAHSLLRFLRPDGMFSTISTIPIGDTSQFDIEVRRFSCRFDPTVIARLAAAVARGEVDTPPLTVLPLAEVAEAHRLAEEGGARKVVLLP